MAQDRMEATGNTPRRTSDAYDNGLEATLARASAATQKVRVVHGANEQYFDNLDGKTVGSVRKSLREVFNIPSDATALVGGKEVQDDFVLDGGMQIEFFKESGIKGSNSLFHKDLRKINQNGIIRSQQCFHEENSWHLVVLELVQLRQVQLD